MGRSFSSDALVNAALQVLEPLYLGETALEPERVTEKCIRTLSGLVAGASITHTISGIDIALWDLLGKATGQPVGRLLGGRHRERKSAVCFHSYEDTRSAQGPSTGCPITGIPRNQDWVGAIWAGQR